MRLFYQLKNDDCDGVDVDETDGGDRHCNRIRKDAKTGKRKKDKNIRIKNRKPIQIFDRLWWEFNKYLTKFNKYLRQI